jgi:hypothetical protein
MRTLVCVHSTWTVRFFAAARFPVAQRSSLFCPLSAADGEPGLRADCPSFVFYKIVINGVVVESVVKLHLLLWAMVKMHQRTGRCIFLGMTELSACIMRFYGGRRGCCCLVSTQKRQKKVLLCPVARKSATQDFYSYEQLPTMHMQHIMICSLRILCRTKIYLFMLLTKW